jgi:hypothetical protein
VPQKPQASLRVAGIVLAMVIVVSFVDRCDTRMNALLAREAKRFLLGFPFRSNHAIR